MTRFSRLAAASAVIAALGLTAPAAAQSATAPSFDHLGASYIDFDADGDSIKGFGLDFEKTLSGNWFIGADYFNVSDSASETFMGETVSARVEMSLLNANVGYKFYTTDRFAAYASAGLSMVEAKVRFSSPDLSFNESDSETGWNAQIGIRSRITDSIELDAYARHVEIDDEDDQIIGVSGRFFINQNFSLGLGYTHINSDLSYISFTARYHF
ncbi:porin family protein [Aliidiomarina halalkaliphila]|uniref:Porin family protein n=1 Tax=Aliidiomarina halalkaliphila TaxID=2593535 RepID=A0A552X5A3_9GAMM|nr:porin family protein [Aliidiomarina halalkaliphila]TRW50178.1 porin family protein [Aliidiomarina halalkaliphila]